jgi:hypothetical protein
VRAEAVVLLAALASLGMLCDRDEPRSFECADPAQVQELAGVHYEDVDCEAAIESAERRLTTAYYRKSCEQLAPSEGTPANVLDAYVASCAPATGDAGGSILTIQLCCP